MIAVFATTFVEISKWSALLYPVYTMKQMCSIYTCMTSALSLLHVFFIV